MIKRERFMAKEKKPSIYVDRGTIGSHDELDEYGVWVKSEPQDLAFSAADSRGTLEDFEEFSEDIFEETSGTDDLDIGFPDMDDIPDFGGPREEDSLDFPAEDSTAIMDDDFDLPEMGEEYEETLTGGEAIETIDFEELDDFSEQKDAGFDEAVGFDEDVSFDQAVGLDEDAGFDQAVNFDEDVSFDQAVGLDEDAGFDQAVNFDEDVSFDQAVGLDEDAGFDQAVAFDETDDSLNLPEELPLEDLDEPADTASPEPGADEDFPEIIIEDIMEEDLAEVQNTGETEDVSAPPPLEQTITSDPSSLTLSTQLLMKIAEELTSIRSELTNLKKGFSGVTAVPSSPDPSAEDDEKIALTGDELSDILSTESDSAAAEETAFFGGEEDDEKIALTGDELSDIINAESDSAAEEEAAFFGGEEDDEKIALTGDELSNILNTADFTEEAGADAAMDIAEDIVEDIPETEDLVMDFAEAAAETETEIEFLDEQDSFAEAAAETETEIEFLDEQDSFAEAVTETETEIEFLDDQDSFAETADPETEFAPLEMMDMDISLEEADLEELELEYAKSGESQAEDSPFPEIVVGVPAEELGFDMSSESTEEEDSFVAVETVEENFPDFADDEVEELCEIQEGVEPITYAPDAEDADYLVEDPLSEDPLAMEEPLDLSEAVIDEPDLSSEIQDNPIEEPSLEDISIDLDIEEDISIPEDIFEEHVDDLESEIEVLDEEIELSMDLSEDISDSILIEEESPAPFEFEDTEELNELSSAHSSSAEDGGDLSLIPEGFVVDAAESDAVELDSMETVSEELISTEFPDFPEESAAEELEAEELEIELDSPEAGIQELESLDFPEEDTVEEFDSEVVLVSEAEFDSEVLLDSEADFDSEVVLASETDFDSEVEFDSDADFDSEVLLDPETELDSDELLDPEMELDSDELLDPETELDSDELLVSEAELDSDDDIISMDDIDDFITETEDSVEEVVEIQEELLPAKTPEAPAAAAKALAGMAEEIPTHLKKELKTVLSYMDQLLESLPDEKIEEFAKSEHYDTYKKLFKELGLV